MNQQRRILLCTYAFPPLSGPTEMRWCYFLRFLVERGWCVDVIAAREPKSYLSIDRATLEKVPDSVRIKRTFAGPIDLLKARADRTRRGYAAVENQRTFKGTIGATLQSLNSVMKATVSIPDRMVEWVPLAFVSGVRLAHANRYDLLVSSSYPFSSHILAWMLMKVTGLRWLGDISDPFADTPENHWFPAWRKRMDVALEGSMLHAMNHVVVPTEAMAEHFRSRYGVDLREKMSVVGYGYESNPSEQASDLCGDRNRLRIVYTGAFYKTIRNPYPFFEALSHVKDEPLQVVIAGPGCTDYQVDIDRLGLGGIVEIMPAVPKSHALSLQRAADVLLLLGNKGGLQLPGKIFDYIAARKPILCVRNDVRDLAADIVSAESRGIVVENLLSPLVAALRQVLALWRNGALDSTFDLTEAHRYSMHHQASLMEHVLLSSINGNSVYC